MKLNYRLILSLIIGLACLTPTTNAQFVNFEETWKEFLVNTKTSNISKLTKPGKDNKIDYAKYALMYATTNFCNSRLGESKGFIRDIEGIGVGVYSTIPGYKARFEDLQAKIKAYHNVEKLWGRFMRSRDVSLEELKQEEIAKTVCEKGTLAKYFYMVAHANYCDGDIASAMSNFENRVLKLAERTSLKVSDVPGLEDEVAKMKAFFQGLRVLGPAWKSYVQSGVSNGIDVELPLFECNAVPNMKEYVLRAAADLCQFGAPMLKKIKAVQSKNTQPLGDDLAAKIKWLEEEVGKSNAALSVLERAWADFTPDDQLSGEKKYGYEYCRKDALVKAYVMDGLLNTCEIGQEMLDKIRAIEKEHNPPLNDVVFGKINKLDTRIKQYAEESANLDKVWTDFVSNKDTLLAPYKLADFYCDKIQQIKSWTIKGHMNACAEGQGYLVKIEQLQQTESLALDEELSCRVLRLRIKVWDCRWWELVRQARKETHEERERFGPPSADIMQGDLNSDQQPCETTVEYTPLGYIGIRYVIKTYLCQDIDLAKMGDPEYYKKIATWVDTEVLQKYCEEGLRCKEEFFIYLEGHTDGNAFRGARYKNSLDIPEGTPFTHFIDGEEMDTVTMREITNSLKSNMELGIARAWTVKNQLDFMEVPIKIGAFEHPDDEKGGEFRRIEIELNITNLLLDFYEKRLNELWIASGIGDRPEEC